MRLVGVTLVIADRGCHRKRSNENEMVSARKSGKHEKNARQREGPGWVRMVAAEEQQPEKNNRKRQKNRERLWRGTRSVESNDR